MTGLSFGPVARNATALSFSSISLGAGHAQPQVENEALAPMLRTTIADALSGVNGQATVFVGTRAGKAVLLAPWLAQSVSLPMRLGEKVLFTFQFPAVRLTPTAQDGVLSEADALDLLGALRRNDPERVVVLTDVATSAPLYVAVRDARKLDYLVARKESSAHLFHRFRDDYAAFFAELTSKYRNQLRKKEKVLIERFGTAFELKQYTKESEVQEFLDGASAINKKTYQYRMFGESVDNDVESVAEAQRAAAAGAFRSFILWHGNAALCFVVGHQRADGTYEHRKTGYDPAWSDVSPGIVTNMLLLQRLYEGPNRPLLLDFGSGDGDYKRMFSNESRQTSNPVLIPRRARFMLAFWMMSASIAANDIAVSMLKRLGIKEWLKRRMRRANSS
jgi:CelD/BcsL family acetyltransferase involved in cellulose biosynthesis